MELESIFRIGFVLSFLAMLSIRIYFQLKVLNDQRKIDFREGPLSLAAGSLAALVTIVFGGEYIFSPGSFEFAYQLPFPIGLRWAGAVMLTAGTVLLAAAQKHLGRSFHSLIVVKQDHAFVSSGPYHWIRHPIYTAYLLNYTGGGLLAGNWVLAFVPTILYSLLVVMRMKHEEQVLIDQFGDSYCSYMQRTGRLFPRFCSTTRRRDRPR
ncbi:MAG: isoprenylcysteine carboxylmethyltransferase family protein [Anaerolineales bacterium]|jgi:protein-S-isoprenylcysteine O-methyltransferase Ste14